MSNSRIYPEEDFKRAVDDLKVSMDNLGREHATHGCVTSIGSSLYVQYGASHSDMVKGYEYFAAHGHNNVIMVSALESLIHLAKERIREKHL